MESDSFKNTTTVKNADGEDVDYFGGQKYNEVLAQAEIGRASCRERVC